MPCGCLLHESLPTLTKDADIEDASSEDKDSQDEEEIISDLPTSIHIANLGECLEHYANEKRCPEEKCSNELPYDLNYVTGCPGMEHAHRYICELAADQSEGMYVLLCACACLKD